MNDYRRTVRDDGAVVETWQARCVDCGFVSGFATVRLGPWGWSRTGAGCLERPRRSPEVVAEMANKALRGGR